MTDAKKYNREIDRKALICPYCNTDNDPTYFEADGFLDGETDCIKCGKIFNFIIEYGAIYMTETIKDKRT